MATEVELKAWVEDPEKLRSLLHSHAEFSHPFVKEDTYFCKNSEVPHGKTRFRLRREDENATVTYKDRHREGGTEINREHEFSVSDPEGFIYFVEALGYSPCISKRKEGELFRWGEANVELSRVEGLGWFVEIERLVEFETSEAKIKEAEREIYRILEGLGIDTELVEERYYIEMLREKQKE